MKNSTDSYKPASAFSRQTTRNEAKVKNKVWTQHLAPVALLIVWMMAIIYSLKTGGVFFYELAISGAIIACLALFKSMDRTEQEGRL